MKKMISLFKRNYQGDRLVFSEIVEGAEWVANGEGIATRKLNGTPVLSLGGNFYKRYDVKKGRSSPPGSMPCQDDPDPVTGHWPHWVPLSTDPSDKWFLAAISNAKKIMGEFIPEGTYEAIGPHFQGNYERKIEDIIEPHGSETLRDAPRDFEGLRDYLATRPGPFEGIVWHHPDGRMVKIKAKDFGVQKAEKTQT